MGEGWAISGMGLSPKNLAFTILLRPKRRKHASIVLTLFLPQETKCFASPLLLGKPRSRTLAGDCIKIGPTAGGQIRKPPGLHGRHDILQSRRLFGKREETVQVIGGLYGAIEIDYASDHL